MQTTFGIKARPGKQQTLHQPPVNRVLNLASLHEPFIFPLPSPAWLERKTVLSRSFEQINS